MLFPFSLTFLSAQKKKPGLIKEAQKEVVFEGVVMGYKVTLEEYGKTGLINTSTSEGKYFFKAGGNMARIFNELDKSREYYFPYNSLAHKYFLTVRTQNEEVIDTKQFAQVFYDFLVKEED